ncbi:hypothetical protein [Puia dinghuensis]|uniref:Type IX secretion system membrane protein PorP/SprF n=1 Tax=Puia dinghuensis TaxID=1792502 RepID=A0A8J2UIP3_9BACT|nr:hypothetical protein [Puia dinghuensis]GGB23330.1 hypothetical protein GCM10011511_53980 [Puia dinghuensis]
MMRLFLAIALLLPVLARTHAQTQGAQGSQPANHVQAEPSWTYRVNVNIGCNLIFTYGPGQRYAGYKVFAGASLSGLYHHSFVLNYGPSLAVYTKSLGANLNPLVGDIQLDLINSFSIGSTWGGSLPYLKFFRTIGNASYYNFVSGERYAALATSSLVLNNHKRNQVVGAVTFSSPSVTINYYNDGAFPFTVLPVADNFDRYWTGGFGMYFHNKRNYNTVEFSFDQFTGYSPLLYELSGLLGINIPVYDLTRDSSANKRLPPSYNTSAYNLKIYMDKGYAVDAGVIGSLRTTGGAVFGLQDIIHTLGHFPLHPNNDPNRFYIGGTYNQFNPIDVRE